ncbi:hypothetical protein ACU8KH_01040 [Lachancea thermotolerans]
MPFCQNLICMLQYIQKAHAITAASGLLGPIEVSQVSNAALKTHLLRMHRFTPRSSCLGHNNLLALSSFPKYYGLLDSSN